MSSRFIALPHGKSLASILIGVGLMSASHQSALAQERLLYTSSLQDWGTFPSTPSPDSLTVVTQYTEESLTFCFQQVLVRQDGCSSSFYDGEVHPLAMTERKATPYIATSPLRSVTRIRMVQRATGGNCGLRVEARGGGDDRWVTLLDQRTHSGMHEDWIEVNRTDVQIRWSNLSSSQNAYLFELDIYGNVDDRTPRLDSFTFGGQDYDPGLFVTRNDDNVLEGTVRLPKTSAFPTGQHPLTRLRATEGAEVRHVAYRVADSLHTDVALQVGRNGQESSYLIHFVGKPDYPVRYLDGQGRLLGSQWVEEDAPIGTFALDGQRLDLEPGMKFRGWCDAPSDGDRISPARPITQPMDLYALVTAEEVPATRGRLFYELRNPHFDPQEHEGFNVVAGDGHYSGRQHGWLFAAGSEVEVLTGTESYIVVGACAQLAGQAGHEQGQQPSGNRQPILIGTDTLWMSPRQEGERCLYHYRGASGPLRLRFIEDTYIHSLAIDNVADDPIAPNAAGYYVVRAGDAMHLLTTIDVVNDRNASAEAAPARIFIPDGDYDLGVTSLTPLMGHHVSLIGQSMEHTIIHSLPWIEGIGTATLLNLGTDNYLQDLTLRNDLDYYADTEAGRAPCLQDNGDLTICHHVRMLSYQDTYYSNRDGQRLYWEDCELHGAFDYLCGRGTVYYNRVKLVLESLERDRPSGEAIITAPYTAEGDMGYIFDHCEVEVNSATFNWGRAWGGHSHLAFLWTRIPADRQLAPTRFEPEGMNAAATDFYEYGTTDASGREVTPQSNVVHFTHQRGDQTYETVLPAERLDDYALDHIFPGWHPDEQTRQKGAPEVHQQDNRLSWTCPSGPSAALITVDGKYCIITPDTSLALPAESLRGHRITVRLAGARGGFGEEAVLTPL